MNLSAFDLFNALRSWVATAFLGMHYYTLCETLSKCLSWFGQTALVLQKCDIYCRKYMHTWLCVFNQSWKFLLSHPFLQTLTNVKWRKFCRPESTAAVTDSTPGRNFTTSQLHQLFHSKKLYRFNKIRIKEWSVVLNCWRLTNLNVNVLIAHQTKPY